jgi:hypothetical protein
VESLRSQQKRDGNEYLLVLSSQPANLKMRIMNFVSEIPVAKSAGWRLALPSDKCFSLDLFLVRQWWLDPTPIVFLYA